MAPLKKPPYDINDPVNLFIDWYNQYAKLADPADGFTLRLVCPDGTIINKTEADCEQLATGKWKYVYTVANGIGTYKGTWTAPGQVVRQFSFPVRAQDGG